MNTKPARTVRPDSKGRIALGVLAKGISSFVISLDAQHRIILEPLVEIPAQEQWLFKNKKALHQVKQGIEDSGKGKVKSRSSFAKFKDENID